MQKLLLGKGPGASPRGTPAAEATIPTLAVATAAHACIEPHSPPTSHALNLHVSTFKERRNSDAARSAAAPSQRALTNESANPLDAVPGKLPLGRGRRVSTGACAASGAVPDAAVSDLKIASLRIPSSVVPHEEGWLWGVGDSPTNTANRTMW